MSCCKYACISLFSLLCLGCSPSCKPLQEDTYLVGAHYYLWYPRNFYLGTLRGSLIPPQLPEAGCYNSTNPAVIEGHIALASRYGIDFFTLDWWPWRTETTKNAVQSFLQAKNVGDIKFCIFYETWSLGFEPGWAATVFDEGKTRKLIDDFQWISRNLFSHPSYLRIAGRPVVILYLSRTFSGHYQEALQQLRYSLREYNPFIIGDEIFWRVSPAYAKDGSIPLPLQNDPQTPRIKCFDAITSYNLYENENVTQQGYPARSTFMNDVVRLYTAYRNAAHASHVCFVPDIIPGYNDRGVRLSEDHYPIPRQWDANEPEGSFFEQCWQQIAHQFIDQRLNMVLITSWNEWNEDTAIEPLRESLSTSTDHQGSDLTKQYSYAGFGDTYLRIIRDQVVAVSGQVIDNHGDAKSGVPLQATDGITTNYSRSDYHGYYRFSRLKMNHGTWHLTVSGQTNNPVAINIPTNTCLTNINFIIN